MSIVDKLKDAITGGQSDYEYRCRNCGNEFESPHSKVVDVTCRECASADVTRA